jgi:hypothetical protein
MRYVRYGINWCGRQGVILNRTPKRTTPRRTQGVILEVMLGNLVKGSRKDSISQKNHYVKIVITGNKELNFG